MIRVYYDSKGNIYLIKNEFELALKSYKKAISYYSNYFGAIVGCDNSLYGLKRFRFRFEILIFRLNFDSLKVYLGFLKLLFSKFSAEI